MEIATLIVSASNPPVLRSVQDSDQRRSNGKLANLSASGSSKRWGFESVTSLNQTNTRRILLPVPGWMQSLRRGLNQTTLT